MASSLISQSKIGFTDIIKVTVQLNGSSFDYSVAGMTTSHVCCCVDYNSSAFDKNGGITWETKLNSVYIQTKDGNSVSPADSQVTLYFGVPVN